MYFRTTNGGGSLEFDIKDSSTQTTGDSNSKDRFTHICLTHNETANNGKIYVNGVFLWTMTGIVLRVLACTGHSFWNVDMLQSSWVSGKSTTSASTTACSLSKKSKPSPASTTPPTTQAPNFCRASRAAAATPTAACAPRANYTDFGSDRFLRARRWFTDKVDWRGRSMGC